MIFIVLKLLWAMLKCCHNLRPSDDATRTLNSSIAAMAWYISLVSMLSARGGARGKKESLVSTVCAYAKSFARHNH